MNEQEHRVSSWVHTSGGGWYWQEREPMSLGIKALMPELAAGPGNSTAEAGPEKVTTSGGECPESSLKRHEQQY